MKLEPSHILDYILDAPILTTNYKPQYLFGNYNGEKKYTRLK